jgi:hypothetical protein
VLHPMATNNNGPRGNASHQPIGVKFDLQRQYTLPRPAKKRRNRSLSISGCPLRTEP